MTNSTKLTPLRIETYFEVWKVRWNFYRVYRCYAYGSLSSKLPVRTVWGLNRAIKSARKLQQGRQPLAAPAPTGPSFSTKDDQL